MISSQEPTQWLTHLSVLLPINRALVVGAGRGTSEWIKWLKKQSIERVVLVEADTTAYVSLQKAIANQVGWESKNDIFAEKTGDVDFYSTSLSSENGLLHPSKLIKVWPNIKIKQQQKQYALSFNDAMKKYHLHPDLLIINCFGIQSLLGDAFDVLKHVNIVVAKVTQNLEELPETDLNVLVQYMEHHNFKLVQAEPIRHHSIAYAVFVKDYPKLCTNLIQINEDYQQNYSCEQQKNTELNQQKQQLQITLQQTEEKLQTVVEQSQIHERQLGQENTELNQQNKQLQITLQQTEEKLQTVVEQSQIHERQLVQKNTELKNNQDTREKYRQQADKWEAIAKKYQNELAVLQNILDTEQHRAVELEQKNSELIRQQAQLLNNNVLCAEQFTEIQKQNQIVTDYLQQYNNLSDKLENSIQRDIQESRLQQTNEWVEIMENHQNSVAEQFKNLLVLLDPLIALPKSINTDLIPAINNVEKKTTQAIQKQTSNAVQQLESYMAIENYLSTGALLSGFHGWPISPDIGLFIINQMRRKQYDLIIEFGSGTSTLLFAKLAAAQHHEKLMSNLLPQKIISFDHHIDYYHQTQELLNLNHVAEYVDLVHAPLREWKENEQIFLYYDCEAKLQQLAQILNGKQAKILVLVDGPAGNTCQDARYPAVPFLFKYLAEHQIDVILDDANRPEEQKIINQWHALMNKEKDIHQKIIQSEKGIYFFKLS